MEILQGIDFGSNVQETIQTEDGFVMKVCNETGEGYMTSHNVLPGTMLMYNDFHMSYCESKFQANDCNLLCIDHCREGRIEQDMNKDVFYYLEPGDLCVDMRRYHAGTTSFPMNHYHGVCSGFYLPKAEKELQKVFRGFSVDLVKLREKFCHDGKPYVIKASPEIAHIFSELYSVPEKIKKDYYRLKVLELLLYLEALEVEPQSVEHPYFYKSQVETVKEIQRKLTRDLTCFYTVEELAKEFMISQTALKKCFKGVYGSPIFSYMQVYRMNVAAKMLKRDAYNVAEIAGNVGYDSPSKFAAVFKKVFGMTPMQYRKMERRFSYEEEGRISKII